MPFKYNHSIRHKIAKQKYRVEYNEALRKRGDLTVWISDDTLKHWRAERRKTPGGQHKLLSGKQAYPAVRGF